jgi:hypothetical protein
LDVTNHTHPPKSHKQERAVTAMAVLVAVKDFGPHRFEVIRRHPTPAVPAVALVQVAEVNAKR